MLILIVSIVNGQSLIRVNNDPRVKADFTSLQDANDNASDGDTIYMEGSATSYDGAIITKKLVIVGPGYFLSENPNTQAITTEAEFSANLQFKAGSQGSTIEGCDIYHNLIQIYVDSITVKRCKVYSIEFHDTISDLLIIQNYIDYQIKCNTSNVIVSNTIIANNILAGGSTGILVYSNSGPLLITNNIVCNVMSSFPINVFNSNIQNNILTGPGASVAQNTGNSIINNLFATTGTDADGNKYNMNMALVFADFSGSGDYSADSKWQLKEGSPAIGAGIGGVDCGVFGGTYPYVLSGIPEFPHIYSASIAVTATAESGLPVVIKIMSQK